MLDNIITIIRFPVGIIGIIILFLFYLLTFPFETVIVIIVLPVAALIMSRKEIHYSWLSNYPLILSKFPLLAEDIWEWVIKD
jgi:hypothetical protein